jgi:hypothetical protein
MRAADSGRMTGNSDPRLPGEVVVSSIGPVAYLPADKMTTGRGLTQGSSASNLFMCA